MNKLIIIKLGGSVITNKRVEFSPRRKVIRQICQELTNIKMPKILIHGAGSFGHPIVEKYQINHGFKDNNQLKGFTETCIKLRMLNTLILEELMNQGLPAVPFHPSNFIIADQSRIVKGDTTSIKKMLQIGLTPLLHGDIVYDRSLRFSVVSGDQIATYLANLLKPQLVIFGCDVDGVYSHDPKSKHKTNLIKTITPSQYAKMEAAFTSVSHPDVTGGMKGKISEAIALAENGIESVIINLLNPKNLSKLFDGTLNKYTRIKSEK